MTTRPIGARRLRSSALVGALASLAVLTAACTTTTAGADATTAGETTAGESAPSSQGAGPGSSTASAPADPATDVPATDVPAADSSAATAQSSDATAPPPATTPVAPASAGDITQTVAAIDETTLAPASFQQSVAVDPQVTATVDGVQRVDATGRGVGEISGPALAYTVTVSNTGSSAVDLAGVSVNVQDQAGAPFSSIEGDPSKPLTGSLEPGQSAQGTYVFTLPADFSGSTTLSLAYAAGAPIALFTGDAS